MTHHITIASRLITMIQVNEIESAMLAFGITDPQLRPLHFARTRLPTPVSTEEPLAAVFLRIAFDDERTLSVEYEFRAGYRVEPLYQHRDIVQPDSFLAMVRFATLLKNNQPNQ